jgi:hypothetical protein
MLKPSLSRVVVVVVLALLGMAAVVVVPVAISGPMEQRH